MSFREKESEEDLRGEMEAREEQHRVTVERLQIQVRGDSSILNGFTSLRLPVLLSHRLSLCLSQIAQLEKKEPGAERENNSEDSSLFGTWLCY